MRRSILLRGSTAVFTIQFQSSIQKLFGTKWAVKYLGVFHLLAKYINYAARRPISLFKTTPTYLQMYTTCPPTTNKNKIIILRGHRHLSIILNSPSLIKYEKKITNFFIPTITPVSAISQKYLFYIYILGILVKSVFQTLDCQQLYSYQYT